MKLFFRLEFHKILIPRKLPDPCRIYFLQNTLKEGLTRKLFNRKELRVLARERKTSCEPRATSQIRSLDPACYRAFCGAYGHARLLCAFGIEGQGQMSQRMGVGLMWKKLRRRKGTGMFDMPRNSSEDLTHLNATST